MQVVCKSETVIKYSEEVGGAYTVYSVEIYNGADILRFWNCKLDQKNYGLGIHHSPLL